MKLRPMLVAAGPLRGDDERYAFEVKWDGFRALVEASPNGVTVWSRNGHDMTSRYPELQGLAGSVRERVILDGELVCLDEQDFAALWFRNRGAATPPVCFMVFDLLELGERSLLDEAYRRRRVALEDLALTGAHWCTPEIHVGEGSALFTATKQMGLEGVVAKHLDSRYRPGLRSRSWTKTKHFQERTFARSWGGCRQRSGGGTAVVWPSVSGRVTGSRSLASWSQAMDARSSTNSRA